ncbi:unnamed protein product [Brassica oleracea]|uniref:Uncharacterized protein n=1 Tax=Brassica oleracea TaxID=3712 RepID=A0A3P6EF62_BRAOL|nr:unnamed protein product [Brassica oleracea]
MEDYGCQRPYGGMQIQPYNGVPGTGDFRSYSASYVRDGDGEQHVRYEEGKIDREVEILGDNGPGAEEEEKGGELQDV